MTKATEELVFVGLDLAKTAGMAILSEDLKHCWVYELKGTPYEQFYQIQNMIANDPAVWGIEELHIFRNAKTVRSLAERVGFVKWMLKGVLKEKVMMVTATSARKYVGAKSKEQARELMQCLVTDGGRLTDNHSDAVLVALMVARETLKLDDQAQAVLPSIKIGQVG
jgi:hypothetical protein